MSIELKINIVQEVAFLAPQNWNKIQLNIEIDDVEGELVISPKGRYFIDDNLYELRIGVDATDAFERLREVMARNDKENRAWTICDLEVQSDGQFKFQFSYDEPPRLATLKS